MKARGSARLTACERIRATVDVIPRGRVASYGQVAAEAGLVGRARLVGRALRELPEGSAVPWHRVVNASGRIAARAPARGRASEAEPEGLQRARLESEGVRFDARGRIDLDRFGWRP